MLVAPGHGFRSASHNYSSAASTRCTTLVPTPTVRPIFNMPMPSADALLDRGLHRLPAEPNALLRGPRKPGIDALDDHCALKLGEHAAHLKHGAA